MAVDTRRSIIWIWLVKFSVESRWMPRYFTPCRISIEILLRDNKNGWSFCLDRVNTRACVLCGLRVNLLAIIHSETLFSSSLLWVSKFTRLWLLIRIQVSSANKVGWYIKEFGRSLIYKIKRSGPKIEPWGTPYFILILDDLTLSSPTYWNLSDK